MTKKINNFDIMLDMTPSEMGVVDASSLSRCPLTTTSKNSARVKWNIVSLMDSSDKDELKETVFPKTRSPP